MDVYPDAAVALGALKTRSPFTRLPTRLFGAARRRADGTIALGPCMRERLIAHGIPASKIHVAENWADGSLIEPHPLPANGPFAAAGLAAGVGLFATVTTLLAALIQNNVQLAFATVPLAGALLGLGQRSQAAHAKGWSGWCYD